MVVSDAPEMVAWADFVPEVLVVAPDAPPDLIEHYVREAAIALAERSQVLIREVAIDLQEGVTDYPIRLLDGAERIVSVQHLGTARANVCCAPRTRCAVPLTCGGAAHFERPDRVVVLPAPRFDRPQAIFVRVAVAPARNSCEGDRLLYEDYHEAVLNGALARVYLLKGMPWFDAALATYHRGLADRGILAAGMDRLTGGQRGIFRVRGRRVV